MLGNKLINTNAGGGCTNTVDLYNPFPDGGGVALYQLNGDATDVSGNYNGTATNVTYGAGEFGQAGVFNGSSSVIDFAQPLLINTFSVSVWVKTNNISTRRVVLGNAYAGSSYGNALQILGTSGYAQFEWAISNSWLVLTSSVNVADGNWHNTVVTISEGYQSMYVDGNLAVSSTNANDQQVTNANFKIGANWNNTEYFNGSIDQVRVFNRALRPYEVEALYTEEYCTPTIVPSEHFNTVVYSGNGTGQSIDTVGFAPDLVWVKNRLVTNYHILSDTVRGINKQLYSNTADAEQSDAGFITGFNIDGFDVGNSPSTNTSGSDNMVAWNFKAGGAAVTNTDGTITSQVSANTEAGFSIVTFTGNGANASVGHGFCLLYTSPSPRDS